MQDDRSDFDRSDFTQSRLLAGDIGPHVLQTPVLLSEALLAHHVDVCLERPSGALPPDCLGGQRLLSGPYSSLHLTGTGGCRGSRPELAWAHPLSFSLSISLFLSLSLSLFLSLSDSAQLRAVPPRPCVYRGTSLIKKRTP